MRPVSRTKGALVALVMMAFVIMFDVYVYKINNQSTIDRNLKKKLKQKAGGLSNHVWNRRDVTQETYGHPTAHIPDNKHTHAGKINHKVVCSSGVHFLSSGLAYGRKFLFYTTASFCCCSLPAQTQRLPTENRTEL